MSEQGEETRAPAADDSIDWNAIRKRLKKLQAMVGESGPTAAARQKVLRQRAADLSESVSADDTGGDRLELLEFTLGDERYAIDSDAVREVYALRDITPVPGTPSYILGVVSVRGRIVSVMDLGRLFEAEARPAEAFEFAIVLQSATMEFAVLADDVKGMHRARVDDLQTSLPTLTGARKKYFKGVTPERVTVLDATRLLGDDSLVVREDRGAVR
jgi:purine-binding chemotaxis protein CheW